MYDAALEPAAVNVAQWGLLRKLSDGTPLSIGDLAARAELERSTVARNVRVLEKSGFVEIGQSGRDRRSATIALGDKGVETLRQGAPLWSRAQQQFEDRLGADVAPALRSLLHSI